MPMILTEKQKDELKKELVLCLKSDEEVRKIVVFAEIRENFSLKLEKWAISKNAGL